jgi:hypothetical protein
MDETQSGLCFFSFSFFLSDVVPIQQGAGAFAEIRPGLALP